MVKALQVVYSGDSVQRCKEVCTNLRFLREKGLFCDVVLSVAGERFLAHRSVLAAASEQLNMFLRTQCSGFFGSNNCKGIKHLVELNLKGISDPSSLKLALDYIYGISSDEGAAACPDIARDLAQMFVALQLPVIGSSDAKLAVRLVQRLAKLRAKGHYCDLDIVSADEQRISVHCAVLAAASRTCCDFLCTSLPQVLDAGTYSCEDPRLGELSMPSEVAEMEFEEISKSTTVQATVEFLYGQGPSEISDETEEDFGKLCSFFGISHQIVKPFAVPTPMDLQISNEVSCKEVSALNELSSEGVCQEAIVESNDIVKQIDIEAARELADEATVSKSSQLVGRLCSKRKAIVPNVVTSSDLGKDISDQDQASGISQLPPLKKSRLVPLRETEAENSAHQITKQTIPRRVAAKRPLTRSQSNGRGTKGLMTPDPQIPNSRCVRAAVLLGKREPHQRPRTSRGKLQQSGCGSIPRRPAVALKYSGAKHPPTATSKGRHHRSVSAPPTSSSKSQRVSRLCRATGAKKGSMIDIPRARVETRKAQTANPRAAGKALPSKLHPPPAQAVSVSQVRGKSGHSKPETKKIRTEAASKVYSKLLTLIERHRQKV